MQYGDGTEILSSLRICTIFLCCGHYLDLLTCFSRFRQMSQIPGLGKLEVIVLLMQGSIGKGLSKSGNIIHLISKVS